MVIPEQKLDLLDYKCSRLVVIIFFLCLCAWTDHCSILVAESDYAKVPDWLLMSNYMFIGLSCVMSVIVLFKELTGGERKKGLLVLLALLLPFNSLWFFKYSGSPALIYGKCSYYVKEGTDGNYTIKVSRKGDFWPPEYWEATQLTEVPMQPACNSVISTELEKAQGPPGNRWEELYELALRLFGFTGGYIADQTFDTLAGGFAADVTDIIDLYMISYSKINLMIKGKSAVPLNKHAVLGMNLSFDDIVLAAVLAAYALIFIRLLAGRPEVRLGDFHLGPGCNTFLSLIQEVVFLLIRGYAWYFFEIPVSVLIIKNIVSIISDISSLLPKKVGYSTLVENE